VYFTKEISMIKVGDRVYPWMLMNKHGKVLSIKEVPTKGWMLGGVLQTDVTAVVHHDTGEIKEYPIQDLMKSDT
jgi:hypothetical protein